MDNIMENFMKGSVHDTIEKKLEFLYKQGRKEQVGTYFRNQNLNDPAFDFNLFTTRGLRTNPQ